MDQATLQHMAAASYLGDASKLQSVIAAFSARARELHPSLTDKATCAIYVASERPGISSKDLEAALQCRPAVITAVLCGLCDLGLVTVTADGWLRTVALTDDGRQLVAALGLQPAPAAPEEATQAAAQQLGGLDLTTATAAEVKAHYDAVWPELDQQMRRRDLGSPASPSDPWWRSQQASGLR